MWSSHDHKIIGENINIPQNQDKNAQQVHGGKSGNRN